MRRVSAGQPVQGACYAAFCHTVSKCADLCLVEQSKTTSGVTRVCKASLPKVKDCHRKSYS